MGFEPMNNGFAIRPLSPLGYAAGEFNGESSIVWGRLQPRSGARLADGFAVRVYSEVGQNTCWGGNLCC